MIIFKDIQESSGIWSITMCEIFSDNIEIIVTRTSKIRKEVNQIMSNIEMPKSVDLSEIIDISKLCEVHNNAISRLNELKDINEYNKLDV